MGEESFTHRFRLLRVAGSFEGSKAVPVDLFPSPDDAMDAAAQLSDQPIAVWQREPAEGVWSQVDESGRGFVIVEVDRADDVG